MQLSNSWLKAQEKEREGNQLAKKIVIQIPVDIGFLLF